MQADSHQLNPANTATRIDPIPDRTEPSAHLQGRINAVQQPLIPGLVLALAVGFLGYLGYLVLLAGPNTPLVLTHLALITIAVFVGICGALFWRPLPVAWTNPFLAGVVGLILVNCAAAFFHVPNPHSLTAFALLLVGASGFILSPAWLAFVAGSIWTTFCWLAWRGHWWDSFGLWTMAVATALAFALHHLRRRTFRLTPALPGSADRPQAALLEVMHSARSFDCLFVHDKGLILEVNEATSAVFGYARTELPGKNITTLFSADSRALVSESVLLGNFRSIECTCVRQNGDTFQAELFSKKASCEDHDLMVTTIRDISDRKRLESTLDKERRQLQMFYQRQAALTDIQKAIDQRGEMPPVLNQIAQVAAQFLPASIGSCLLLRDIDTGQLQIAASCFRSQGAPTDPPQEFHPGTATQWILDHRESLVISQKGSDPFGIAQVFPGLDTQAYAGIPIFSAGIIAGMLFVLDHQLRAFGKEDLDFLTNLTVKAGTALVLVHLSESLHQTSSKLEQQRSEWEKTRADLAQAKDKAEAANHFKSAFLQQAGQALRVPLSGIMSMTNLLLLSSLPDESRQIVETLRDAAQLLLSRLNAVSDFVQILSGNLRIKVLDFDLSEVLKGTIKNHLALAQKKHLELQVHLADPIPRSLRGDAARLEQVLSELMTNAVKFTERGQIEIRVTRVSTDSPKIRLRFEVRDTGPGIAPANQVKLFQPFAVIGDPNTHPDSGMRLGLALSRHLVELMDGQMGVQSEPGAGSTFWFTVSLQEATIIKP